MARRQVAPGAIGEQADDAVAAYLKERGQLGATKALFVNAGGSRLTHARSSGMVSAGRSRVACTPTRPPTPAPLVATHLLDEGADLLSIQKLLAREPVVDADLHEGLPRPPAAGVRRCARLDGDPAREPHQDLSHAP